MNTRRIVVCGTGIVGLAAALGLTKAGGQVTLLGPDMPVPPVRDDEYCPRVYAISPASQQFLEGLGVWAMMDASRLTPVEAMEVYGDASGKVVLRAWQAALPILAWIVESSELERVLRQAVQVFGISRQADKFRELQAGVAITESGKRLEADLLVGADGANSPVRAAAGISHESKAYSDTGLVVHLTAQYPHQNTALQWFTADGVLALLPLPDTAQGHQVSMVWSMPEAHAAQLQSMPENERNAALELRLLEATGGRLGRLTVRSPLLGFPLFLEKSGMVAAGVALVGDAAHRVHPLAGQGLNLGLGDVEKLIDVVRDCEPYRGIGEPRVLNRYRRARAEAVMAMGLATDGLYRLFASQAAPVVLARNVGMRLVDKLPMLKRFLISGASGG
ncbi:FAD-dependent monooxygenase [Eoetvoesiella caeni]|uniref:2-octaprenyl-3-methyl-6-methoxy-1,4-benzoquinol hydroxylase n=1 Tax=Eoetvoesiella caeni TaxID=645616 RepID=A0A366H314_9BURK|nr:FAD-dependent monooxygenase [Eoetvoesiella caeni]MCI2810586.1 FAD-dependent monooxygenase [Eoetvoesiella caeni]NYT56629.1 FAD-dependent monooxygenase [Eoetvoesiella caeni]RBP36207.1 2-octaprenyl-3-methyl-6-methoxy-1,4-benzoquinol hydroxylase [Eoetvoesiella caeni]